MPSLDANFDCIEAEDFKPIKRLGYGDMGTVILSNFHPTGQPFALKVMNKEIVQARDSDYRVFREAEILSMLDHPFLPRLYSHFESKKHIYFVMDYCPGGDMNILRRTQPEKQFSENAARFYAAEVVLAMEYLHENGIIYRDLKPENVLIQEDGHIMLTDFDLSIKVEKESVQQAAASPKLLQKLSSKVKKNNNTNHHRRGAFMCGSPKSLDVVCASHKAVDVKQAYRKTKRIFPSEKHRINQAGYGEVKSQSFVGTEEYVAPEMILGCGHGMALDWWTFGIFLYEMLYGTTPFKGKNRRDTFTRVLSGQPEFPGSWTSACDLINKLLVKDSSKRLGFSKGAQEIKEHPFFKGVNWETIQHVSRPPWVPPPLVLEDLVDGILVDDLVKQTMPAAAPEQVVREEIETKKSSPSFDRKSHSSKFSEHDEAVMFSEF